MPGPHGEREKCMTSVIIKRNISLMIYKTMDLLLCGTQTVDITATSYVHRILCKCMQNGDRVKQFAFFSW